MPIFVRCQCGANFKAKDALAGKRVKCPKCAAPLTIPEADLSPVIDLEDDDLFQMPVQRAPGPADLGASLDSGFGVGDSLMGAAPLAGPNLAGAQSNWANQPSWQGQPMPGPQTAQHGGNSFPLGLVLALVGGGVALFMLLACGGFMAFFLLRQSSKNVAHTNVRVPTVQASPGSSDDNQVSSSSPTWNGPPPQLKPGKLWVVLSDFKQSDVGFNKTFTVKWELERGYPQSNARYVWVVQSRMAGSSRVNFIEYPVNLKMRRGVLTGQAGGTFSIGAANFESFIAKGGTPGNYKDLVKVSGVLKPGESKSAIEPPKTAGQIAGAAAAGKMIALANPKIVDNFGLESISVDYEVLKNSGGRFLFLIVEADSGRGMEFDFSREIRSNKGKTGTLVGRLSVVIRNKRPYKIYVEARNSPVRSVLKNDDGTVVSNLVTLN